MRLKYRFHTGLWALMLVSLVVFVTQCVEEYNPKVSANDKLLVVDGSIIRGQENQTIYISRSNPVRNPGFKPVIGCVVSVTDDKDNVFLFEEVMQGKYVSTIDSAYLKIGAKFKLTIETPDNKVYASGFEEILDGPSIDNVYFIEETKYSEIFERDEKGHRLNLDVYAENDYVGYYSWKVHETWEQRASNEYIDQVLIGVDTFITTFKWDTLNSEWILDMAIPVAAFDSFSKPDTFHICYLESEVQEFFLSSTSNIVSNTRKRVPLQFIANYPKLSFRYSCLVSQYTLSEEAYTYWQNKIADLNESGDLYYSQPSQTPSNIKNIHNETEAVLGYFWVSEMKQKRVFFDGDYAGRPGCSPAIPFDVQDFYIQDPYGEFGEFIFNDVMWSPVYIINGYTYPPTCFDCRVSGGTLERPDYW